MAEIVTTRTVLVVVFMIDKKRNTMTMTNLKISAILKSPEKAIFEYDRLPKKHP